MKNALKLQRLLNSYLFPTLAAGGFVRDYLLGVNWKDIDLATTALPEQVTKILYFHKIMCIPTGLKHGTVTAVIEGLHYEITTLRVDTVCKGREAEVEFVDSFEEDAKRRDLTINAMFMDLETKQIFDYVGGKEDLKLGLLRFVGSPEKRIQEDYLRILRLFRFYSQLNFKPEPQSLHAGIQKLSYLCFISQERIRDELCKMIIGKGVVDVFRTQPDMVFAILPELVPTYQFPQNCTHHYLDVYEHTLIGLGYLATFKDSILSISHLFHDVAKPFCHTQENGKAHFYGHEVEGEAVIGRVLHRLKFATTDINRAKFLVRNHMRLHGNPSRKALRRLLNECEEAGNRNLINDLYKLHLADLSGMNPSDAYPQENIAEILLEQSFKCPLSGKEIMDKFNLKEGSIVGRIKEFLKDKVIEGFLVNDDKEGSYKLILEFFKKDVKNEDIQS